MTGDNGTIIGFKNIEQLSDHTVAENMAVFRRLKEKYPNKFILASIMGRNEEEWTELAGLCQENGADAIELNFSCPNMADEGMGSDIGQVPELVEKFTAAARRGADIPILAKLTPNIDRMSPAAEAAKRGGADGIAAINTIKSMVDINPHTYVSSPSVRGMSAIGGYSGNAVKPIALRFIAELAKNPNLSDLHISAMGGIETWKDALEYILLGAGSVQVTTAVMQYGYRIIDDLISGLNYYLAELGFQSVEDARSLALDSVSETMDVLERDTVIFFRRKEVRRLSSLPSGVPAESNRTRPETYFRKCCQEEDRPYQLIVFCRNGMAYGSCRFLFHQFIRRVKAHEIIEDAASSSTIHSFTCVVNEKSRWITVDR